jgi:hypothetical protein
LACGIPAFVLADDSAAAIAAGGLEARRETRIVMAREVLRISPKKVVVDYDFRNDTDQDVTAKVAFPIPPYKNEFPEGDAKEQSFQSFRLWGDGKRIDYLTEAKATLKGKDVTALLQSSHIDIPTFGHFDDTTEDAKHITQILVPDFTRLPKTTKGQLIKEGLFEDRGDGLILSLYTVHLQYHWTQTFPAHSTVHIRHEYTPNVGYQPIQLESFKQALAAGKKLESKPLAASQVQDDENLLASFCPDTPFLRTTIQRIEKDAPMSGYYAFPNWVDFILTSANTWKRPIEDFTLTIERGDPGTLVSLCSPGRVEKLDANHFQVYLTDFVPTSELHIGFFTVSEANPGQATAKK